MSVQELLIEYGKYFEWLTWLVIAVGFIVGMINETPAEASERSRIQDEEAHLRFLRKSREWSDSTTDHMDSWHYPDLGSSDERSWDNERWD